MTQLPDSFFRALSKNVDNAFREWAHKHYSAGDEINPLWHPSVRDECKKINEPVKTVLRLVK